MTCRVSAHPFGHPHPTSIGPRFWLLLGFTHPRRAGWWVTGQRYCSLNFSFKLQIQWQLFSWVFGTDTKYACSPLLSQKAETFLAIQSYLLFGIFLGAVIRTWKAFFFSILLLFYEKCLKPEGWFSPYITFCCKVVESSCHYLQVGTASCYLGALSQYK